MLFRSREENFAICPLVQVGGVSFMEGGWVGEGEDNRAGDVGSHFFDDLFGEATGLCGGAKEDVGFDGFNHREEVNVSVAVPFGVVSCVGLLGGVEFVALALKEEAWFVHAPILVSISQRLRNEDIGYHICFAASSLDFPLSVAIASRIWSAIPVPAVPAPKITTFMSTKLVFETCRPAIIAAKVTQPVPCTSSLKQAIVGRYLSNILLAAFN